MIMRQCIRCGDPVTGRKDKKFCNESCKAAYHYERITEHTDSLYRKIDKQLKLNRRVLKNYNKAGKAFVRRFVLFEAGFNPKYFTHTWTNQKGDVYCFCYEYGFLYRIENGKAKYILITWQDYMN